MSVRQPFRKATTGFANETFLVQLKSFMAAANRDWEALLNIVDAAQQIQVVVQSLALEAFKSNREKQAAVLYFCITIGEATKRISQAMRTQHPDIPWREMVGLRDILAHQYDRVDMLRL